MRAFRDMVSSPRILSSPLCDLVLTPLANSNTEDWYAACCEEYLSEYRYVRIESWAACRRIVQVARVVPPMV